MSFRPEHPTVQQIVERLKLATIRFDIAIETTLHQEQLRRRTVSTPYIEHERLEVIKDIDHD